MISPEVAVVQIGGVAGGNFDRRKASNHISVSGPDIGDPAHLSNSVCENV